MGKLLSLVLAIVVVSGLYIASRYTSDSISQNDSTLDLDSYELGKRFPASDKIVYERKSLKSQKIAEVLNKRPHQIHNQNPSEIESQGASGIVTNSESSIRPQRRNKNKEYYQEIEKFVNPVLDSTSSSLVPTGGDLLIVGAHVGASSPASSSSSSSSSSQESGSVTPVEEIKIRGKVIPLMNLISSFESWPLSSLSAYAAPVCSAPKVGIYLTEDLLKLGVSAIQEQELKPGAEFLFVPSREIDKTKPQKYSLQVSGCDVYFSRIITDFYEIQDINFVSTLISFSQVSPVNISPENTNQTQFKDLVKKLEATGNSYNSYEDIFNELNSMTMSSAFSETFNGSSPEILKSSLPVVSKITLPASFDEEVLSPLTVEATHWSGDYDLAVEWFIDGVPSGFGSNWNWAPQGNSQPSVQIKVLVGKKKTALNEIDTDYPYHQFIFVRQVNNTVSPTPLDWTLDSVIPNISSTVNLLLELETGPSLENCSSFSAMAVTETPTSPDLSAFNIVCTDPGTQSLSYSLDPANRMDGNKTLYLWARDGYGDISSTPKVLHFYLDQTAPDMTIASLNENYGGGQSVLLSWKMTDHTVSNTQFFEVEFFDGTSWFSLPDVALMNGPLVEQTFTTSYTLPDSNLNLAKFRISATDLLGHSSSFESETFNIKTAEINGLPASHNFGDIAASSVSPSQTIIFTNASSWPSGLCSSPSLTGHNTQFTILSETCSGSPLAASASCQVIVRANPALRQAYTADINLACGGSFALTTVMVTGDNNPPTLGAVSAQTLNEDTTHAFSLTAGSDIDGDSLTYQIVSSPLHGSLTSCLGGTADISCSYTPDLNYNGSDSFSYRAYDGQNYSSPITVSLTINPVNDAPTLASTQSLSVDEDTLLTFSLNEGADIENDTLNYIVVGSPASGTLTCVGGLSRSCTYQGNQDFNGTDTFTYKVNDGFLDSNIATVTITINPINDEPEAADDYGVTVAEDSSLNFTIAPGSDIDLPAQVLTYVLVSGPSHGVLSACIESGAITDRSCTYTPTADYNGPDSFTYRVCDPFICSSNTTTINLTVDPANDAPVMIANQAYSLDDTQYVDFSLNGATDIDLPAQTLSYRLTAAVSQGTLSGCIDHTSWNSDTTCRYTPPVNYQGTVVLTYKAYDDEDESVGTSTITFTISDKTPSPVPNVTLFSDYITNQSTASLTNLSCTDIDGLFVSQNSTQPLSSDGGWVGCTTTDGGLTSSLAGFNGIQKIYVWSKDQYGNVSTSTEVSVVYDSIAPVLVVTSTNNVKGNDSITIHFTSTELHATSAEDFEIRYHNGTSWSDWTVPSSNGPHNAQAFSTTINTPNSDNILLSFEITYRDIVGNVGSASVQFYSDLTQPYVDLISINGGATDSTNNNIQIAVNAHDDTSKIQSFCLKYNDSTQPTSNSSCWKNVNAPSPGIAPAQSISFSSYFFQIGFTKGTYTVYAWVKDEAGLISVNTSTVNIDKSLIDFDPGTPPRVIALQVTNSNTPQNPVVASDLVVGNGSDIFVKWNAQDTEGLAANPIKIEYSLNDVNFYPLGPDVFIPNSVNAGCTIDARFTGCTVLPAPSGSYFKVRVIAKDSLETVVYLNSPPLNEQGLRIIAGNTENGLGGSALSALFYTYGSAKNVSYPMKNTFAASEDGKFFYLDPNRGLLWVDPATGVLSVFIPTTGAATNGDISGATLVSPAAITIDAYNHLLIWDHNLIRRVNLEAMTISTIIGGGNQTNPSSTINASDFEVSGFNRTWGSFIPLPNGDILFNSPVGVATRRYRAIDQKIETLALEGVGFAGDPGADWNSYSKLDFGVTYNTTTSQIYFMAQGFYKSYTGDAYSHYARIDMTTGNETTPYEGYGPYDLGMNYHNLTTGLDGKLYILDRFRTQIKVFDHTNNTLTPVLGTGGIGSIPCTEGTAATSCAVDIDSYFVTKNSRIYFIDNGVIRTIDDSGNVISLFGQFPSYGNGELATIARFGNIRDFKLGKHSATNDKVIVMDGFSSEFREFTIDSTVEKVASVGVSWDGPWRFEADPATGDIFVPQGGPLYQYQRTTETYIPHMNAGAYSYSDPASDGRPESEVLLHGYSQFTLGFISGRIFLYKHHWVGYDTGCIYKGYDMNDSYRQEHFLGNGSCAGVGPNFGDPLGPQSFGVGNIHQITDPADSVTKLIFNSPGNGTIYTKSASGTLEPFISGLHGFTSFATKIDGTGLNVFYCSGGRLYKYNKNTTIISPLSWISPTLYCTDSRTIVYNPERNSLIFMFNQNGLHGIGEYKL